MIRLADVEFRYGEGDFALRIPQLGVEPGERLAVIGPSGSGKTTLLHLIAGIETPRRGSVRTAGIDLADLDDAARRAFRIRSIGLVFQAFELLDYLNVRDNILLPYRIHPTLKLTAEVRARGDELARRVGLTRALDRLVTRLSQGERQRVAVCRALITEPTLILADEPTGNLDPANKGCVLDILCEYAEEQGATLLTVTHDLDLLDRFGRAVDFKAFQEPPSRPHAGGGQ